MLSGGCFKAPKAENSSVGISQSVILAPHGEGHQAERGIDSAELILERFLFIVCYQNISPTAIPADCIMMQYSTYCSRHDA